MTTYEFLALVMGFAGLVWGYNKWLYSKIERGDKAVQNELNEASKAIHERISQQSEKMVPRVEHEKEMARLYQSMDSLRNEVVRSSERTISAVNAQASRVDQVLIAVQKQSTGNS